jgi:hypothetical protein
MKISLRTLAIGGSVLAVLFLTGTAAAVSAQTTTAAHPVTAASQVKFHPFTIVSPNFREDTFLPVSAEFGGPGIAEISPDVVGATSTIGKFRLPLGR